MALLVIALARPQKMLSEEKMALINFAFPQIAGDTLDLLSHNLGIFFTTDRLVG